MVGKKLFRSCDKYVKNPYTGRCINPGSEADVYLRKLVHFKDEFISRLVAHGINMREAKRSYKQWRYIARLSRNPPVGIKVPSENNRPKKLPASEVRVPPAPKYVSAHKSKYGGPAYKKKYRECKSKLDEYESKKRENPTDDSDDDELPRKRRKGGSCDRFVFLFGAGASADAGIPTFRDTDEGTKGNSRLVKEAQKSWRRHYAELDLENPKKDKYIVPIPGETYKITDSTLIDDMWNTKLSTNEKVLSEDISKSYEDGGYPKVLQDVWAYLVDIMKDTRPGYTHSALEYLFGNDMASMVVSMNIDGLEWALDIPDDKIVSLHGCVFVGSSEYETRAISDSNQITDDMTMDVTLYGGYDYYLEDQERELKSELEDGACLVAVGTSGFVIPDFVAKHRLNRLIVVNPKESRITKTKNKFKYDSFESFPDMKAFMKKYAPGYRQQPISTTNSSHAAIEAARRFISSVHDETND